MPEIITCPDCGRKLRVPDELIGKPVKCPDCKVKFTGGITTAPTTAKPTKTAPASPKAAAADERIASGAGTKNTARPKPNDDEDDRPTPKSRVDDDEEDNDRPAKKKRKRRKANYDEDHVSGDDRQRGWRMTLQGLNLLVFATYAWLATVVLGMFGCLIVSLVGFGGMSSMDPQTMQTSLVGAGVGMILLYAVLGLGYFATWALQMTGHGFCMAIPDKVGTGRKVLAIITFCCACATIVLYLGGCAVGFVAPRAQAAGHIGILPAIGLFVCYFLFLRSVAVAMREEGLAQQCVYYLIAVPTIAVLGGVLCCVIGLVMGVGIIGAANANSPEGALGTMGAVGIVAIALYILFLLIWLGMIAWYIVLLHQIRNAVRDYVN